MAQSSRANRKVLVLPGDGIGPEIMREVMRVFEFFDRRNIARFEVGEGLVGGAAYDASGTPLTDATLAEAMADASALKRDLVAGLDLMIVRELTGGIYFGEPRGVETLPDGTRRGINTEVYTEPEIERVVRAGFDLARKRNRRVCEVDKANVMESGGLWREVTQSVRDANYPDVELSFLYADNC